MGSLHSKKCLPCEGHTVPLTPQQYAPLLRQVPLWNRADKAIERAFSFKNFKEALAFVNQVGALAEKEGHHPDIFLYDFKNVKLSLSTHAIGGLSENDFILAAKIDELAA